MIFRNNHLTLFIDTGGTFTDALAADQSGNIIARRKVLSSSSLRELVKKTGNRSVEIQTDDKFNPAKNFYKGYQICFTGIDDSILEVIESNGHVLIVDNLGKINLTIGQTAPVEIQSPEEAPLLATRLITNTPLHEKLPSLQMRLSTTRGTNALLERGGAKTLFLITEGFKDLLKIKNQQRPDLFSLPIRKSEPFSAAFIEVPERMDSEGNVLKELDIETLRKRLRSIPENIESAGICLMHSYINPEHELQVKDVLKEEKIPFISRSSALSPTIKIVPRAVTTEVNSYLSPVMQKYLDRISSVIEYSSLRVMGSSGSLIQAEAYNPKDGLLSGPAGGVIGAAAVGKRNGFSKIISFDMGGTSTDVSRYDGKLDYIYEHTVGDATLSSPAVEIETVAAGGGSICNFDGKSLTVGPESAGADPGPACYGQGGPLTITDVNLLSGRLDPANFHITIHPKAAEDAFENLMQRIRRADPANVLDRRKILEGFLDIANERMAQAIHKISIQKGFNPSDYSMVAFGGAGAQHALAVANKLNIKRVIVPSDAGLLSAYGLQQARLQEIVTKQVLQQLPDIKSLLDEWFEELIQKAKQTLVEQGVDKGNIEISRKIIFMRLQGQDTSLEIESEYMSELESRFQQTYQDQYGHWIENRSIEVEAIRVIASEIKEEELSTGNKSLNSINRKSTRRKNITFIYDGTDHQASVFFREEIEAGINITGPSLILDPYSTTVVDPGWTGSIKRDGTWIFENQQKPRDDIKKHEKEESINLQLYINRFTSIAEQMGEMLRRTAISVNVKERLDFSCALLDSDGYLVVNAPHIPVHLGAMGSCVRTLLDHYEINEGDVLITNHPGFGGSHLPDVTIITPVFSKGCRVGFTASRAHHAEIGGKRPGSMPPDAKNLAEEGVVISPMYLSKNGNFNWEAIEQILKDGPYPTRALQENMADIRAAVSANYRGSEELKKLIEFYGKNEVLTYMQKLRTYAAERMRSRIEKIDNGVYNAKEILDDGAEIVVNCFVENNFLSIDFEGTAGVQPGNLNANPSIVKSVVIYVLRLLVNEPLPLNDGLLEPVEISIPKGLLNPDFPEDPADCPAVVGGNIETSQRLTDTLLKAFKLTACSYGTMNNVLFGNESFGYYETVGGGTGAGDGFHGADAVHQHMTNTRATDPEILEHRYPVTLDRYEIRKESGGRGKWNGGNGIIRQMTFREPVSLSVLTQHRTVSPYGMKGGETAKPGKQSVTKNGNTIELSWRDGIDIQSGDSFTLETPGGGGFGSPEKT